MHAAPRTPARGNWIWLAAGLLSFTVLTGTALHFAARDCRPADGTGAVSRSRTGGSGPDGGGPAVAGVTAGTAVYYEPRSTVGSCSFVRLRARGVYVSLPPARYGNGAACGSYLDVTGPHGSVLAQVVDVCAGCGAATINLSRAAFTRVAGRGPGPARVSYRQAEDPPLPGPIQVRVAPTITPGLLALQILRHGNPLASVAIAPAGTPAAATARWHPLTLNTDDYWVGRTSPGGRTAPAAGPVALLITDNLGHRAILTRITLIPGTTVGTATWMYRGGAPQSATRVTVPASPAATRPATPAPGGGTC